MINHSITNSRIDYNFIISKSLNQKREKEACSLKFTEYEDQLLCAGLARHGLGNWEALKVDFMPYRSSKQLSLRFKNMTSRRSPQNIIKVLKIYTFRISISIFGCLLVLMKKIYFIRFLAKSY